jgi:hypothetical protein
MTNYKRHALSQIFPDMPEDEIQALADDIKINGQHDAIWLVDGKVLDGWHRYKACLLAGVNPRTLEYRGTKPAEFVKSKNWHRRHLTASQRTHALGLLAEWAGAGKPAANQPPGGRLTNEAMAKEAGASISTVKQAKAVIAHGSKALNDKVRDGEVSVKKAASVVALPKGEQVAALEVAATAMAEVGVDLVRELEHADTEIRKLTAQVESLSKTDQAAESQKWQQKFYELEGRLNQCMTTKAEAEKSAKYATGMLAKIRKLLGVQKNGEIEAAIMGLIR